MTDLNTSEPDAGDADVLVSRRGRDAGQHRGNELASFEHKREHRDTRRG